MISNEQRDSLYKLGYNDKQIDKMLVNAEKVQKVDTKKKKDFTPTYKKHLRIFECEFCNQTYAEYMVLKEVEFCSWVGSRVTKEEYDNTKAFKGKPTRARVKFCDLCDEYVRGLSVNDMEAVLMGIINSEKGVIVC